MILASVIVPLNLDKAYTYLVTEDMPVKIGSIVQVNLRNKTYNGVIIDLKPHTKEDNIKYKAITSYYNFSFSESYIKFIKFFQFYSFTSFGLVASLILRNFTDNYTPQQAEYLAVDRDKLSLSLPGKITAKSLNFLNLLQTQSYWYKENLLENRTANRNLINNFIKKGILQLKTASDLELYNLFKDFCQKKQLTAEQVNIVKQITDYPIDQYNCFLLSGVTGCGKTEIYLAAIERILQQKNHQILVLLPEISLTQQFIQRFKNYFGFMPDCWHSGLSKAKKQAIWHRVYNGESLVVIGARSALFLPFKNLKLIVVDEEHDSSYKQEENIFYNARDMAVSLAKFNNIAIILSSATPSVESFLNAKKGKYKYLKLEQRHNNIALPKLHLIDLNRYALPKNCNISEPLRNHLAENLARKQQSILFIGRRGYAPLVICKNCSHEMLCKNCSVYLNFHQHHNALLCHYCGHREILPKICPNCAQEANWGYYGCGVERLAEEVKEFMPAARSLILSTDLSGNIKLLREQFSLIENHEVDVVIGTQMICKGHNFSKVSLVGVIDGDLSLRKNELRAAERTYQTLLQVTGRAGRSGITSCGYIQTENIKHPVLQAIIKQDLEAFYKAELEQRQAALMPPFSKLAALIIISADAKAAEDYAKSLRRTLPKYGDIAVFGPSPAPIFLLKNEYRYRILLQAKGKISLHSYLNKILASYISKSNKVKLQIDIDPQNFS